MKKSLISLSHDRVLSIDYYIHYPYTDEEINQAIKEDGLLHGHGCIHSARLLGPIAIAPLDSLTAADLAAIADETNRILRLEETMKAIDWEW